MFRFIYSKLISLILLLCLCTGGICYFIFGSESEYRGIIAGTLCLIALITFFRIIRSYRYEMLKVQYLLEAVENSDYTFRFAERNTKGVEIVTNKTLNRVKDILLQTKQDIIAQEQYFELILDKSLTGFIVSDNKGHIHQTNQAALDLLGLSVLTHISQIERTAPEFQINEELQGEGKQIRVSTTNGIRHISLRGTSFKRKDEELLIITLNDISSELDEKELESWIRLTRVLTHEIMNSIAPIRSVSEYLLQTDNYDKSELRKSLDIIHNTSGNLMNFVEHYRRFARIPPARKEEIRVEEILMQCRRMMINEVAGHVKLYVDTDDVTVPLLADRGQIVQAIINLLRNAADAVKEKENGRIKLSGTYIPESNRWIIGIENNGDPISKEMQEQIFIPFFTTKEGGSGIGLSISKQIMRNHQGNLQLTQSNKEATLFSLIF
ncbi:MAG: sensor histidine kinase [Bacteroidales bacterium]